MDISAELDKFESSLEALRMKYELFFSGREKKEPGLERTQVEANARRMLSAFITNSGLMYRLKGLTTRLTSYQGYWDRVLRQIEEGTYKREIDKRKLTHQDEAVARAAERKGEDYIAMNEYLSGAMDEEIKRATEEALGSVVAPKSGVEKLFEDYVSSKIASGEKVEGLSLEKFKRQVNSNIPAIRQKMGTEDFEFKVVVKDGRTTLRAFKRNG